MWLSPNPFPPPLEIRETFSSISLYRMSSEVTSLLFWEDCIWRTFKDLYRAKKNLVNPAVDRLEPRSSRFEDKKNAYIFSVLRSSKNIRAIQRESKKDVNLYSVDVSAADGAVRLRSAKTNFFFILKIFFHKLRFEFEMTNIIIPSSRTSFITSWAAGEFVIPSRPYLINRGIRSEFA